MTTCEHDWVLSNTKTYYKCSKCGNTKSIPSHKLPKGIEKRAIHREPKTFSMTVEDAVSGAQNDVQELHDEIESWQSNMEGTGLENTGKYEQLSDCLDNLDALTSDLEEIDVSNLSEEIQSHALDVLSMKTTSRARRLEQAMAYIQAASDYLSEVKEKLDGEASALQDRINDPQTSPFQEKDFQEKLGKVEEQSQALDEIIDSIQTAVDDSSSVEFPGMY